VKIIVFGDIHGNLPALEVALREARAEGYDILCHSGDVVGFAPFPNETVALLRSEKVPGVRGNLDDGVVAEADDFGGHAATPEARAFEAAAYDWTLRHTERAARNFLNNLPFEQRLDAGGRRTVLVHATPIDLTTCLWENRDEDYFREMGDAAEADMIIFGHTHRPYHRIVDGRHFINVGSVGYPGGDDPRTGYTVIQTNGNVEVQYRRYPYDTARLLRAAEARGFAAGAPRLFKA
jgi:putative phosphoesterase